MQHALMALGGRASVTWGFGEEVDLDGRVRGHAGEGVPIGREEAGAEAVAQCAINGGCWRGWERLLGLDFGGGVALGSW